MSDPTKRLMLERLCEQIFDKTLPLMGGFGFTLLVFDFGDSGDLAFKSQSTLADLLSITRAWLKRWDGTSVEHEEDSPLAPTQELLQFAADGVKAWLPAGIGYALFCGFVDENSEGRPLGYVSNAERVDVAKMLRDELIPRWEQQNSTQEKMREVLAPYPPEVQREALLEVRKAVEKEILELDRWAAALALQWHAPPGLPKTAANFEVLAMNATHFLHAVRQKKVERGGKQWDELRWRVPSFDRVCQRAIVFGDLFGEQDDGGGAETFLAAWRSSAYARVEISHKLAAALALTDTDGVQVESPWLACSLVVPDGLLDTVDDQGAPDPIARLWCVGANIFFVITSKGTFVITSKGTVRRPDPKTERGELVMGMLRNLARGAFLALANPDDFRKQRMNSSGSSSKNKRSGAPDLAQARFMLSADVKVDLRPELAAVLSGKRRGGGGSAPTVQFLVRGHWRQQAHGPGRALRKSIWIQPFWKGPEETRVLLRAYKIEGS
jgi:hypothetical protein